MKEIDVLTAVNGPVVVVISPSGYSFALRQQNGEDDDILTNAAYAAKGTGISRFLSGIIVDSDVTPKGKLSYEEVAKLRVSDIYYLLIASRVFSMGPIVKFTYKWEDIPTPVEYEEDLGNLIWDYKIDFPYEDSEFYSKYRIRPTSKDSVREMTLSTGKRVSYEYLTPEGESYLLKIPEERQSINAELLARRLKLIDAEGKPQKVDHFRFFSSREMLEIRKDVIENDPPVLLVSEIEHPISGQKVEHSIMRSMDFFFPRGI